MPKSIDNLQLEILQTVATRERMGALSIENALGIPKEVAAEELWQLAQAGYLVCGGYRLYSLSEAGAAAISV